MLETLSSQPTQASSTVVDVFAPVTAVLALLGTVGSFLYTARSTKQLAIQQQTFQRQEADRLRNLETERDFSNAYDALFRELKNASRRAASCIQDIAKWSRKDVLSQKPLRIGSPPFFEIVYSLTAPLAVHRIIAQRARSQMFILKSKTGALLRYEIAEKLGQAFLDDETLAELNPSLHALRSIDRNVDRQRLLTEDLINMQLVESRGGELHHSFFQELLRPYDAGHLSNHLVDAKRVFVGFTPERRPLLWQLLIVQLHLNTLIAYGGQTDDLYEFPYATTAAALKGIEVPWDVRPKFDWRPQGSAISTDVVLRQPFEAAQAYLAGLPA